MEIIFNSLTAPILLLILGFAIYQTTFLLMRFIFLIIFSLITFNSFTQITFPVNGNRNPLNTIFAFKNATITTSPGEVLKNGTLLIKDGVVIGVGYDLQIPSSAVVYDLKGAHIYHSFIDPFSNYGMPAIKSSPRSPNPQIESTTKGAYNWNEAVKAETNAAELFSADLKSADGFLKNGFGLGIVHVKDGIFRGTSALVSYDGNSDNEALKQSRVYTAYSFDKGTSRQDYPSSLMGVIALMRQTFYDAQWYKIANHEKEINLTLDRINETENLPRLIEVDDYLSIYRADKIAKEFGFDFIFKGNGDEYMRAADFAERNLSMVIPLNFPKAYDVSSPYNAMNVSLAEMKHWENAPFNAAILAEKEVSFVFTADGLENIDQFLPNWRKCIEAGLSTEIALSAVTTNVAKLFSLASIDGTIQKGKPANFFISSAPIFENDAVIYEQWINGSQKIINNRTTIDIRGDYDLNIDSKKQYTLSIKGSVNKLNATMQDGDSTIKALIELNGNQVALSFSPLNQKEIMRLTGHVSESKSRIWTGNGLLSNGDWVKWGAIKKADFADLKKKDTATKTPLTRGDIWFPNMAFGSLTTPQPKNMIIRDATVWTNEDKGILKETDVLVVDGKIAHIGPKLDLSIIYPKNIPEIIEIDAKGLHLTPGIIDEHSHIAISRGVNESGQANSAEVSIGDVVNSNDINIYRQLSGGVTTSQLLHGSANPIGGQSALIKLKWGTTPDIMNIDSAKGHIKFALGENVKQSNWGDRKTERFPQTRMGVEQVYFDDFYRAKEYSDLWTLYNAKSNRDKKSAIPPRKDLELEALVEILNKQRFITCHSYVQSEINMLMHVADSMGFKVNTFTHILEGYKVADKMKEHGAYGSTFSDWWAYKFEVNDAIPYNGAIMHKVGITTGFNSDDAEMGRRLNQEAAKAVKYGGVSEIEAFKFVSLNPAKMLQLDHRIGSIKEGKDADIVLWSENPLSIYAKVQKTIIEGAVYFDVDKDAELRKQLAEERERLVQKMLLAKKNGSKTQKPEKREKELYECDTIDDEGYEVN